MVDAEAKDFFIKIFHISITYLPTTSTKLKFKFVKLIIQFSVLPECGALASSLVRRSILFLEM